MYTQRRVARTMPHQSHHSSPIAEPDPRPLVRGLLERLRAIFAPPVDTEAMLINAWEGLYAEHLQAGRLRQAAAVCRCALGVRRDDIVWWLRLARVLSRRGLYADAFVALEEASACITDAASLQTLRAVGSGIARDARAQARAQDLAFGARRLEQVLGRMHALGLVPYGA